jgi:serine/threonine-protein kinase
MSTPTGEQFGRYELVSELGRGGMAEIYRARLLGEAGVTKPVLIKKVLPEFATDQAFIEMFISEARISATLSHGNIAQVYDFGRVGGEYFLAMEYVDGQPLHRIIKRARRSGLLSIPDSLATFIALEMCKGLHYAHTRKDSSGRPLGIVHRDISPDNVLISYEGQVKIVDFGIAKARELRGFNTEPGVVKGKYLFFSPEQAQGEEVDARTDVWASGIVLYEMLCGRLPVEGPPQVVMPRLIRGQFTRPSAWRPELSAQLDAIVMRALAVKREERYESCHAFGEALTEFLYASSPRFSSMTLSHFVQELFREDLSRQGHRVQVPQPFLEQMSQWRQSKGGQPRAAGSSSPGLRTPPQPESSIPTVINRPPASLTRLYLGLGGGVALLGAALTLLLVMRPQGPASPVAASGAQETPSRQEPAPAQEASTPGTTSEHDAPADAPPSAVGAASPEVPQEAEASPVRASASYPIEAIRLDARTDVIDTHSVTEKIDLEPAVTYRISEPEPPQDSPPLFFWISGPEVRAKDGVGVLSRRPVQLKGAAGLKLFALKPLPPAAQARQVLVENVPARTQQRVTLGPGTAASTDRAFELKNLDRATTYRLLLVSIEEGAYTRGEQGGATESVACVRLPAAAPSAGVESSTSSLGEQQFLLREGASVQLSGASSLVCGFIDDDPTDNRGELQLRITRTSGGPAWVSPSQYSLVAADKVGEVKSSFEEAMRLFQERQYDRAAIVAERCLSLAPSDADCHLLAGATYASIPGKTERAAGHYRSFLELAPQHPLASQVRQSLEEYERRP